MTFGQTIKSYLLWTHPRGGFHYDVMVTVILAFIFLTPRTVFKDSPNYRPKPRDGEIVVHSDGNNAFLFELNSSAVSEQHSDTAAALEKALEPIAGPVVITRWEEVRPSGRVTGYRVWAHR